MIIDVVIKVYQNLIIKYELDFIAIRFKVLSK